MVTNKFGYSFVKKLYSSHTGLDRLKLCLVREEGPIVDHGKKESKRESLLETKNMTNNGLASKQNIYFLSKSHNFLCQPSSSSSGGFSSSVCLFLREIWQQKQVINKNYTINELKIVYFQDAFIDVSPDYQPRARIFVLTWYNLISLISPCLIYKFVWGGRGGGDICTLNNLLSICYALLYFGFDM